MKWLWSLSDACALRYKEFIVNFTCGCLNCLFEWCFLLHACIFKASKYINSLFSVFLSVSSKNGRLVYSQGVIYGGVGGSTSMA